MLPDATLPASLTGLLENLKGGFTTPSFRSFHVLVAGAIAQTGRHTVSGRLSGSGLARLWPHDPFHHLFSRASWDPELVGIVLSHLIAHLLLPEGAPLVAAVDDTLFSNGRGRRCSGRPGSTTVPQRARARWAAGRASSSWACSLNCPS